MSRPENSIISNIVVLILCAGEGHRMKNITTKIPKPLIKIPSQNNKPILQINLDNLDILGLKDIFIVTGHLGHLIDDFLNSVDKNIKVINSKEEYKKGPLNSFLEGLKSHYFQHMMNEIHEEGFFLVMPGDTIFELNLLRDIFDNIGKKPSNFNKYPFIFYRNLNCDDYNSQNNHEIIKKARRISIAIIEKAEPINILKEINHIDLKRINIKERINQIIPIFFFPRIFIKKIFQLESLFKERTIKALMNKAINNGEIINAIELLSEFQFYDIDEIEDLNRLNKKKRKDNSNSMNYYY